MIELGTLPKRRGDSLAWETAAMTKILRTRVSAVTEVWVHPSGGLASHKLGQVGPAREGHGFEASREMKSGLENKSFQRRKAAENWIIEADGWEPLQ